MDREFDEEIGAYLADGSGGKMRKGMSHKVADRAVRLERGSVEIAKEVVRAGSWETVLETCWRDLCFAVRVLRKSPGITAVAVLTLSLGIGANTAIFSMVYGVILRPLSFKDAQQLYTLWERNLKMGYEQNPTSAGNVRDWSARNHVFEHIAAFDSLQTFNLIGKSNPERVEGAAVSPGLFDLPGVSPVIGRALSPSLHATSPRAARRMSIPYWLCVTTRNPYVLATKHC